MPSPFVRKLRHGAELSAEQCEVLKRVAADPRPVAARQDLIREGDKPDNVHLLVAGWACRYKVLPDGGRQIMAYLVPGDFCDLHVAILGEMDHTIATLSPCSVAYIPQKTVEGLTAKRLFGKWGGWGIPSEAGL